MYMYGAVGVKLHAFVTLVLDGGGQLQATAILSLGEKAPVPTG